MFPISTLEYSWTVSSASSAQNTKWYIRGDRAPRGDKSNEIQVNNIQGLNDRGRSWLDDFQGERAPKGLFNEGSLRSIRDPFIPVESFGISCSKLWLKYVLPAFTELRSYSGYKPDRSRRISATISVGGGLGNQTSCPLNGSTNFLPTRSLLERHLYCRVFALLLMQDCCNVRGTKLKERTRYRGFLRAVSWEIGRCRWWPREMSGLNVSSFSFLLEIPTWRFT